MSFKNLHDEKNIHDQELIEKLKNEYPHPDYEDEEFSKVIALGFVLDNIRAFSTNRIYEPIKENARRFNHPYTELTGSMRLILDYISVVKSCESIQKLSEYTGLSYKNIYRFLNKLEKLGYITIEHAQGKTNTKVIRVTQYCEDSMLTHSSLAVNFIKNKYDSCLTKEEQSLLIYHACHTAALLRKITNENDKSG